MTQQQHLKPGQLSTSDLTDVLASSSARIDTLETLVGDIIAEVDSYGRSVTKNHPLISRARKVLKP